jgi:MFS family permease
VRYRRVPAEIPPRTSDDAKWTFSAGTRRAAAATATAQKPPIATPRSSRAPRSTVKLGARAAIAAETICRPVSISSTVLAVAAFGGHPAIVVPALLVWALALGAAPVVTQLWLYHETPHAVEAAQAMNTSVFQLSIGLGSLLGGFAVDAGGLHSAMWLGTAILAGAIAVVVITYAVQRWHAGPPSAGTEERTTVDSTFSAAW